MIHENKNFLCPCIALSLLHFSLSLKINTRFKNKIVEPHTIWVMKNKILLLAFLVISTGNSVFAQSIELTPFAGYTFRSTVNITNGRARVNDGFTYGGALTYKAGMYNAIEISYYRYQTNATAQSGYSGFEFVDTPVNVNYMLIGGQRIFPANEKVAGFSGFNLGAGWLGSGNNSFNTVTKFSVGFLAGLKIMASDKLGFRLQTNLALPITSSGGSFFWGTGGSGVGLSGNVPIWSFGFTAGLVYKIK